MPASKIKLETKLVGEITGNFYVASYQRGYRWSKVEIERLLDDIYSNGAKNYCLQPIVVKKQNGRFELIDGQQRLTTIYLIYKHLNFVSNGWITGPNFTITYETREHAAAFLSNLDLTLRDENIDFSFICNAYDTIKDWFAKNNTVLYATNINKYFSENVKVIWYEAEESQDSIALFTRLNIGKIPLTSAELVKAIFLSRGLDSNMNRQKQEEVALQWDNIEKELHNDNLWYFITNHTKAEYQTRIDLVLDLISQKPAQCFDKYYTFFYFDKLRQQKSTDEIWKEIQHTFLVLKDWFENHQLYHKIGYLIATGKNSLNELYAMSLNKTKRQFIDVVDNCIKDSIKLNTKDKSDNENYADLSYENSNDYEKITRLLLLFNVESMRKNSDKSQWFPFNKFKSYSSGTSTWSLEHIHSQRSEGLQTQESWKKWLNLHIPFIETLEENGNDLYVKMLNACSKRNLERREFEDIQQEVLQILSAPGQGNYLHSIGNLALLDTSDNAALSNSTFAVKRNLVIEMDKQGRYIPFCTKMVFLKYYTSSKDNQLHFWGPIDRKEYISAINNILKDYLEEPISIEQEKE